MICCGREGDYIRSRLKDGSITGRWVELDKADLAGPLRSVWPDDRVTAKIVTCTVDTHLHNGWSLEHQSLPPAEGPVVAALAASGADADAALGLERGAGRFDLLGLAEPVQYHLGAGTGEGAGDTEADAAG